MGQNKDQEIRELKAKLRNEQIKVLKLRMRLSVLVQFPKSAAADKISAVMNADADFSSSILYLN